MRATLPEVLRVTGGHGLEHLGFCLAHHVNGGCWLLKWIGSFQGEECRWSGHHDGEEVKSIHVHVAIMDSECVLFGLELGVTRA